MRLLAALLVMLVASSAWAQEVKLPSEIKGAVGAWLIVAPESVDGGVPKWRIDPGLQEVRLDLLFPPELVSKAKGKVFTSTVPGRFKIEAWNAKGDLASDIATCWVVIGSPLPPVPPGPNPPVPPGPEPPVPPQPAGSRTILFLYESANQPSAMGNLLNLLRSGPVADYLLSKKHRLSILDDDSSGSDDRALIDGWKPHLKEFTNADGTLQLPILLVLDPDTRRVIGKKSYLPEAALGTKIMPDAILSFIKQHGG